MKFRKGAHERFDPYMMCVGLLAPSEIAWRILILTLVLYFGPAVVIVVVIVFHRYVIGVSLIYTSMSRFPKDFHLIRPGEVKNRNISNYEQTPNYLFLKIIRNLEG